MLIDVNKHMHFVRSAWVTVWICPRLPYQTCLSEPRFLSKNPPKTLLLRYEAIMEPTDSSFDETRSAQYCPTEGEHRALMKCFSCIKENRCGQPHEKQSCDLLWVPTGQSFLQIWDVAPAESEYSSGTTSPPKARFLDSDLACCRLHSSMFHLVNVLAKYLSALQTVGNLTAGWGTQLQGPTETAQKLVLL